ncbi:MAG: hypothetical protein JWQ71_2996 [Pedosphaera sp.]|nr:hypothetical protein [Pedosphaera sp.]
MNWNQLKTILWLRWRLSRNQFTRGGALNAVLKTLGLIGGIMLVVAAGIGGVAAGAFGLPQAPPNITIMIWDVMIGIFLFAWLIGVLVEIQRSEAIDLARLLHLPVSLQGVFVMNYLAAHVTFSLMLFLPATLGICLGLLCSKGLVMILLVPLVFSFIFMITAWTYCLRGWLVTMMVNPRKRRNVIVIATLVVVLLGQAPNLYINVFMRHRPKAHQTTNNNSTPAQPAGNREMLPPGYVAAHKYVPFLWLPKGATALMAGDAWPAVWGSLGAFLLGAAGLARAYQTTLRFYRGQTEATPGKPQVIAATSASAGAPRKNYLEKKVPFVTEEVAGLFLAFTRSLSRAPEIKMALVTNVIVIVVVGGMVFSNTKNAPGPTISLFIATTAIAGTFFGLIQVLFNQFGYDREGFRALVLLPAARRDVLFAKNLSFAPLVGILGLVLLALITILFHLSPLVLIACCLQLVAMFLLISIATNFFSILTPYRIASGSMKAAKPPAKVILMIILTQVLFPVLALPIFIPPTLGFVSEKLGWLSAPIVDVLLSLLLLALAATLYRLSLGSLGRFLEKREKDILLIVSHEAE